MTLQWNRNLPRIIRFLLTRAPMLLACLSFSARGNASEPVASKVTAGRDGKISFARDIRPILANHCWSCHGSDEATREAGLRLDVRDAAVAARKNGKAAVVARDPEASLLVKRIETDDESRSMPPPDAKKPLSAQQKQLLRQWVAQGAAYSAHWAFLPPQRPALPQSKQSESIYNAIDLFIQTQLEQVGLEPAREASREVLLRRVTLDLTGLPPTVDELKAFLSDDSPGGYERVVDRLLASPRYAERMAMHWLDVARYADTNGYNNDEERTMWPWRDWVIDAFQRNLPYDRFLTEQLAGDLLPEPTLSQKIATGFNRNHVQTTEGGVIDEEYRVEYVADRVHTTATVFMGLSMQCARCHDHKFDPISQREYYQFFGFFNNLPHRSASYNRQEAAPPSVPVPTLRQQAELAKLAQRSDELQRLLKEREQSASSRAEAWESSLSATDREQLAKWGPLCHVPLDEAEGSVVTDAIDSTCRGTVHGNAVWAAGKIKGALEFDGKTHVEFGPLAAFDSGDKFSFSAWVFPSSSEPITVLSKMDEEAAHRGYDVIIEGGKVACHLIDRWPENGLKVICREPISLNEWHHVAVTYDGSKKASGVKLYADGKLQPAEAKTDKLKGTLQTNKPLHLGRRERSAPFQGRLDDLHIYSSELAADEVASLATGRVGSRIANLLAIPPADRAETDRAEIVRFYLERKDVDFQKLQQELANIPKEREAVGKTVPVVMIMEEMPQPRSTHLLRRGQYDQPGEEVSSGVPAALPAMPSGAPANRLGLAQWLVQPGHPLTARVAVNRWWEMFFGAGLVETSEDFGVTGALPSHPELLDWLATELIDSGWNVKALQKQIVMSAAYRRSSKLLSQHRELDPKNIWLARGPRFRLPAEIVRDNALAISGQLVDQIGGPSVKPYQPEGLWEDVSVERRETYKPDSGEGLYRRTMYTFWKRTCPPPSLSTFDAPTRETCTIRRARTNTPLQALVLLNDPTYVEAARKMAERILEPAGLSAADRLSHAFELALSRKPDLAESQALLALQQTAASRFRSEPAAAGQLLSVGRAPATRGANDAELAAWGVVCSLLLNLDETISRD